MTGRTRIVATLGPSTSTAEAITALLDAGVDVFRLNASHDTREGHARRVELVRQAQGDRPTAILLDLAGPKLRLTAAVEGEPGDIVEIDLPDACVPGDPVLLADGQMLLEVVDTGHARVLRGGAIAPGKGVNLPSSRLDIPSLTEKDHADLAFGVEMGVDFVALSFVRRAGDLDQVKAAGLPVVAKIEKAEAVLNLDEIVAAADGVMVARGDLGVEIAIERVPGVQKRVIHLANQAGKPVIAATQMLRSMVDSFLPTRAEATDVANAVLDGTDAVMLSEETAIGRHPVEAVQAMRRILNEAETLLQPRLWDDSGGEDASMARLACGLAAHLDAAAIVVPTSSGFSARQVARFRPAVPIIALTPDAALRRQLSLVWGVTAVEAPWYGDEGAEAVLWHFADPVRSTGLVPPDATVVVTAGWPIGAGGITNLLHVAHL